MKGQAGHVSSLRPAGRLAEELGFFESSLTCTRTDDNQRVNLSG